MSHLPRQPQDITPAWLTEVLRTSGEIRSAQVASLRIRQIGTFSSELCRIHICYDSNEAGAPVSLVLKRPKKNPQERPGIGFVNEVNFYRSVAPQIPVRMPRFYGGYADAATGDAMILMEDVAGIAPVDWERGITSDHARLALEALAKLHARWWEKVDTLHGIPHLADTQFREAIAASYARGWRASRDYFRTTGNEAFLEVGDALLGRVEETLAPMGSPATLLHGDAHFENLALVTERGKTRILFHDWASVRCGLASFDVAVFAVQSFPIAARRRAEKALVAVHADAVRAAGVSGWLDPWLDYRRGVLNWVIHMIQGATLRPGDPQWVVVERYMAAAVDLRIDDLIV